MRNDAGAIAAALAQRIQSLAPELLPHGRRDGQEWRVGGVDGAPGDSMGVHLGGGKSGVWSDFATGEAGDALDLVAAVLYRGDKKAAYAWARAWLGLGGSAPATLRAYAPPKANKPAAAPTDYRRAAQRLWLEAAPAIARTPVESYLRARGVDLRRLGRQPRALRYHPSCRCTEANRDLPAMVAAVTDAAGMHVATHRTWLACRDGVWGKARLREPKKTLGRLNGGTIRLWRGASGKSLREAPAGELLVLGEGIETCLSVALACPEYRVLCAVSMANAGSVVLPEQLGPVVLLADNDGQNDAAARGLARVVDHFARAGREVRLARSPWGKDFNDAIRVGT